MLDFFFKASKLTWLRILFVQLKNADSTPNGWNRIAVTSMIHWQFFWVFQMKRSIYLIMQSNIGMIFSKDAPIYAHTTTVAAK